MWKYLYVTVETYHELLEAESIGKYFIANIKKRPEDHPGEPVG